MSMAALFSYSVGVKSPETRYDNDNSEFIDCFQQLRIQLKKEESMECRINYMEKWHYNALK